MPELPEVETIRRQMQKEVVGARILGVDVRFAKRLDLPAKKFASAIVGASISGVGRRAKLLLIHLSNGWTMVIHLKMTGRMLLLKEGMVPTKHTHLVFRLSGGRLIFFEDVRKFGYVKLVRTADLEKDVFDKEGYGPEPLDRSFTFERFRMCLTGRGPKRIKPLLMAQSCIAGIGNIYADEACWRAKVRPDRRIATLAVGELSGLYDGVKKSLTEALGRRGSSVDDYVDLYGRQGANFSRLLVYGRDGKPCSRCGTIIKKMRLAGRGTHYCPKCQK